MHMIHQLVNKIYSLCFNNDYFFFFFIFFFILNPQIFLFIFFFSRHDKFYFKSLDFYSFFIDDESGEKTVSVLLAGEESELTFIDHSSAEMTVRNEIYIYIITYKK